MRKGKYNIKYILWEWKISNDSGAAPSVGKTNKQNGETLKCTDYTD